MESMLSYQWLYGIPTYRTTIFTAIPTDLNSNIPLPKQLPTQIGLIYGVSTQCDTVDPNNRTLITTAQAQNLYLTLKDGATEFFEQVRLDDLLYNFAGVPEPSGKRYLDVRIPGTFDLSTSFFDNPTGILSPAPPLSAIVIPLTVWYIDRLTYIYLLDNGMVAINGMNMKGKMAQIKWR